MLLFAFIQIPKGCSQLQSYIADGEILPVETQSFGGIGVFGIPEMARFYRHVLIEDGYPHHGAVAFKLFGASRLCLMLSLL